MLIRLLALPCLAALCAAMAFFNPPSAGAQTLPTVGSGNLVLHLKADAISVSVDAQNDVLSWSAENDPGIVLVPNPGTNPGEIRLDPTGMNGNPTIVVTDTGNPFLSTTLPGGVDLTDSTVFWLGHYSNSTSGGQYLYTIGSNAGGGATQLSHQQDGGNIEIYDGSSTFGGDTIVPFRGIYTVWTTQYFSGMPAATHIAYADGVDLNVPSGTTGYDIGPVPHPLSLFAYQGSQFNFEGELAELIVYDGILSPGDIALVEDYLRDRSNETPPLDLSTGTVIQYAAGGNEGCQPDATWLLGPNNITIDQLVNADPSIFLTTVESSGKTIRGRLASQTAPDFMGFVFGYQDPGHYYLFDWKKVAAPWCGGDADAGMRLRVVDLPGLLEPDVADLWGVSGSTQITELLENDIPWIADVDYEFELTFIPGSIRIEIHDGANLVESWTFADDTYNSGLFGLYVNSLQDVALGPIRVVPEPASGSMLIIGIALLSGLAWRRRSGTTDH